MRTPERGTRAALTAAFCLAAGVPVVGCSAEQPQPDTSPATTAPAAVACVGKLDKALPFAQRHSYQLYSSDGTINSPCVPIVNTESGQPMVETFSATPEDPTISIFYACKSKGVLWAAGVTKTGRGMYDFEQSTAWGNMPATQNALAQIIECSADFNPLQPTNPCLVPDKETIPAGDPRCVPGS